MLRPGINSALADVGEFNGPVTDTGQAGMIGICEQGPAGVPVKHTNKADFLKAVGGHLAYGYLRQAGAEAFDEGLGVLYTLRVVGDAAVNANVVVKNVSDVNVATLVAANPGAYANGWTGTFVSDDDDLVTVTIKDAAGVVQEVSPPLASELEFLEWGEDAETVGVTDLVGTGIPKDQVVTLASGADDHASVDNAAIVAAAAAFTEEHGPMQISAPGYATDEVALGLLAHGRENFRVALPDPPDISDVDTLKTYISGIQDDAGDDARAGQMWLPQAKISTSVLGSTMQVPYSAVQSGIIGRNDAAGVTVNQAPANGFGRARTVTGLTQKFTNDQITELVAAGFSVAIDLRGTITGWSDRSMVVAADDDNYYEATDWRTICALRWKIAAAVEDLLFAQIDARGRLIARATGLVRSIVNEFFEQDALFGETLDDAMTLQVTTDPAERSLDINLSVVVSQSGEVINFTITKERA